MSSQNSLLRKSLILLLPTASNSFQQEITELVVSAICISISFGIALGGGLKVFNDPSSLVKYSLISLVSISLGFVLHELGHRIVARGYGYIARYSMWIPGLILGLITSFWGWIFAAPGAVIIRKKDGILELYEININHFGKIALAGPLINIGLSYLFFLFMYLYSVTDGFGIGSIMLLFVLFIGAQVNITLALFNLIPFGPFDGAKIFKWNKITWVIIAALAVSSFIYLKSPQYSIDNIQAPKQPVTYTLYTSSNGHYSFNYPSNWQKVDDLNKFKFGEIAKHARDLVVFSDKHDYAYFALVEYYDFKYFSSKDISDSEFSSFVSHNIRTNGLKLLERTTTTISSMTGDESFKAYNISYLTQPKHTNFYVEIYTHTKDSVFVLCFSYPVKYEHELSGIYTQILESCQLK